MGQVCYIQLKLKYMKKLIYVLAVIVLVSCNSYSKMMKEYDTKFNMKVHSPITSEILYTNEVTYENGFVCFTDHLNQKQCLSNACVIYLK